MSDDTVDKISKTPKENSCKLNPVDILIVDDIHANVYLIESMLSDKFTVASAESSEQIWVKLKVNPPRLVLLDIMMPFENGFQVLDKMKKNEAYMSIPVIVVSAKDSKDDVMKALSLGAVDYITKPIKEEVLIGKICKVLKIDPSKFDDE